MAEPRMATVLTMILVASLWAGAMAQSSCTNVIISMSPCLNYITGNSSTPSSGCCTQLSSVVRSQPQCLCEVLNGGGSSLGIQINQTQALALPTACSVQTPPISRCNGKKHPLKDSCQMGNDFFFSPLWIWWLIDLLSLDSFFPSWLSRRDTKFR